MLIFGIICTVLMLIGLIWDWSMVGFSVSRCGLRSEIKEIGGLMLRLMWCFKMEIWCVVVYMSLGFFISVFDKMDGELILLCVDYRWFLKV